jgi:epi-isozizaene synthase
MNLQEEYGLRPAARLVPQDVEIALLYPEEWKCELHPAAFGAEARTEQWLEKLGLLKDPEGCEKFKHIHSHGYAGLSFPDADFESLVPIMEFLTLWFFYDDDMVEGRGDPEENRAVDAVMGRPDRYEGNNPYHRGWWELGRHFRSVMSERWNRRHGERFRDWLRAVKEEGRFAVGLREQGVLPSVEEFLFARCDNNGTIPTIDFVEYLRREELPDVLLKDPELSALERLASDVIAIVNDLHAYTKDRKNRWCNLVDCAAEQFGLSLEGAFERVAAMHNEHILKILSMESRLTAKAPDPSSFRRWLEGLHHILYGLTRWHADATRYRSRHEIGNGRQVGIIIQEV